MEYFEDQNLSLTQKLGKLAVFVQALTTKSHHCVLKKGWKHVEKNSRIRYQKPAVDFSAVTLDYRIFYF